MRAHWVRVDLGFVMTGIHRGRPWGQMQRGDGHVQLAAEISAGPQGCHQPPAAGREGRQILPHSLPHLGFKLLASRTVKQWVSCFNPPFVLICYSSSRELMCILGLRTCRGANSRPCSWSRRIAGASTVHIPPCWAISPPPMILSVKL